MDHWLFASVLAIAGLGLLGCGDDEPNEPPEPETFNDPDFPGIEFTEPLEPLATPCSYADGVMTIVVEGSELAVVSLASEGDAILVNGLPCGDATQSDVTAINIGESGDGGSQTVALDFRNGFFALGTDDAAGFMVDLGEGDDVVAVRGTREGDSFELGADGLELDGDEVLDVALTSVEAFLASLGPGNDTFTASGGASTGAALAAGATVYGGAGDDDLTGGDGDDTLVAGTENDRLDGGAGDDELSGEDGDDNFAEGEEANGSDTFNGGPGIDIVDYGSRTDFGVTITMDGEADDGATDQEEGDNVGSDVENVNGSDTLDDAITGNDADNVLAGGGGDDWLAGGDGVDTLDGGAGDDTFFEGAAANGGDTFNGGAGADTVDYGGRTDFGVTVTLDGEPNDGATAQSENDTIGPDVENASGSDTLDDVLTGGSSDNVLAGGGGNDTLSGGAGDDTLLGGHGDDVLDEGLGGGGGADVLEGGGGFDLVNYSGRSSDLTITMDGAGADDGEAGEGDNVGPDIENLDCGTGNDVVVGNDIDNTINGGDGDDELHGGAGNDQLSGDAGDDTIFGDEGDDIVDGGEGANVLDCGPGSDIALVAQGEPLPVGCEL